MSTASERRAHEQWLLELTGVPTAAGREDRVVGWVRRWVGERDDLTLRSDPVGNLVIEQRREAGRAPIWITAHMDHPAFVVRRIVDRSTVELEFRGGVHDPYFEDAAIEIIDADDRAHRATIRKLDAKAKPFKIVRAELSRGTDAIAPGDIGRWRFGGRGRTPVIDDKRRLHCPACDDLAAVAAALAALDVLRRRPGGAGVSVLLTVAEEVGFVGAIGACRNGTVPPGARLICLENSRSYAESPIGAGPILRVGDKSSVFTPELTNRLGALLEQHAAKHKSFKWQRRLMPGGTCEATTFGAYGHSSTCVCLPLGNYHNMKEIDAVLAGKRPARVGPETISVDDFHGMVEMLVVCAERLDEQGEAPLRERMDRLWEERGWVVETSKRQSVETSR